MSIYPQFTYDNEGNALGVFLSMQDWEKVAKKMAEEPAEQWEKDLISKGLKEYQENPDSVVDWETIKAEMDKENASI